jgi:uncharacterized protein
MLLNIHRIPEGRSVLSQNVTIEGEQASWVSIVGNVHCRTEIDNIQTQITAHVFYESTVQLECSRCLKKFDYPIKGDFYTLIKKRSPDVHPIDAVDEESDFFYDDLTDELDIRSVLFDEMILALPMKPLCSENCSGISAYKELEKEPAPKNNSDPRWEALGKLKSKKQ